MQLPMNFLGLETDAPSLRRVVHGEGLKPRLKLQPVITQMGACILRAAQFPYTTTATVTNADQEALTWRLDTTAAPADSGMTLSPTSGTLQPGETASITVSLSGRGTSTDGVTLNGSPQNSRSPRM